MQFMGSFYDIEGPFLFVYLSESRFMNIKLRYLLAGEFCLRINKDVVIVLRNPFKNRTVDRSIALFFIRNVKFYFALSNEAL